MQLLFRSAKCARKDFTQPYVRVQAIDLKSMDLEASVDVRAMASAALRHLTVADVNLLKAIIAAGLYPQVCSTSQSASTSLNYICMPLLPSVVIVLGQVSLKLSIKTYQLFSMLQTNTGWWRETSHISMGRIA